MRLRALLQAIAVVVIMITVWAISVGLTRAAA